MSNDDFSSPDLVPGINSSQANLDSILDADGSLATLRSPSLVLQSVMALFLSVGFLLVGRRLHRFSTSASLGLSSAFLAWSIVVNVEPVDGLGPSSASPELRALCVWSIMIGMGIIGATVGYHSAWWGSRGAGLMALGANAGFSLSFGLLLLGSDLLIHSQPATWLLTFIIVILFSMAVMRTEYVASLIACSLVGGFLFLVGVDLLINLGHQGLGKGMCFLIDHNPDHQTALVHYLPPKSTRVMIALSWVMSLLSIAFQSLLYGSTPFIPIDHQLDTNPYGPHRQQLRPQDLESHASGKSRDEGASSHRDPTTLTPATTHLALEKSMAQSSSSSLNPLLVSHHLPFSHPRPSPSIDGLNHHQTSDSSIPSTNLMPGPKTSHPSLKHSSSEFCDQTPGSLSSDSRSGIVQPPSRLPINLTEVGVTPALSLSPQVYSRYRRTIDPAHDPLQIDHRPRRMPSLYTLAHPRQTLLHRSRTTTPILPMSIAQSQQLRRVDTVEEVTETSASIRDTEDMLSARSSLAIVTQPVSLPVPTGLDLVRAPSVSEEYMQAMLRLASQTESASHLSITASLQPILHPTQADDRQEHLPSPSPPTEEIRNEECQIQELSALGIHIHRQPQAVPNQGSVLDRNSWLGAWAHSTSSLATEDDKRFELSMPDILPISKPSPRSDQTAIDGDEILLKDEGSSERPSSGCLNHKPGFDFKKIFKPIPKKTSSSSLGRSLRLLRGSSDKEKSKAEDVSSSDDQVSSPNSTSQPSLSLLPPPQPGHGSLLPHQASSHETRKPTRRLELSTSSSSDLLTRTARRLGPVRDHAARSNRPRGTSILSVSSEELRLAGSGEEDEERRGLYLQRFSYRPLPRLPLSSSSLESGCTGDVQDKRALKVSECHGSSKAQSSGASDSSHPLLLHDQDLISKSIILDQDSSNLKQESVKGDQVVCEVKETQSILTVSESPHHHHLTPQDTFQRPLIPTTPTAIRLLSTGQPDPSLIQRSSDHTLSENGNLHKGDDDDQEEDDDDDRLTVRTPRSQRSTIYGLSGISGATGDRDPQTTDDDISQLQPSLVFYPRQTRTCQELDLQVGEGSFGDGYWATHQEQASSPQASPSLQSIPLPSSPGERESFDLATQIPLDDDDYHYRRSDWSVYGGIRSDHAFNQVMNINSIARVEANDQPTTLMSSEGEDGWRSARGSSRVTSDERLGSELQHSPWSDHRFSPALSAHPIPDQSVSHHSPSGNEAGYDHLIEPHPHSPSIPPPLPSPSRSPRPPTSELQSRSPRQAQVHPYHYTQSNRPTIIHQHQFSSPSSQSPRDQPLDAHRTSSLSQTSSSPHSRPHHRSSRHLKGRSVLGASRTTTDGGYVTAED